VDFLQIPPHGRHPCPWLTVPTAKSVADSHRQVVAHAERTRKAVVQYQKGIEQPLALLYN